MSHISTTTWEKFRTTKESGFEKVYRYKNGWFEFREGAWVIRVRWADVERRDAK